MTLGGAPLPDALVTFSPVSGKTSSAGKTDAAGKYELIYTRESKGAEIGDHNVTISTHVPANDDGDPPTPEVPEKVPLAYRDGTKPLKATVASGSNTIDFALEPGPVDPPMPKGKGKRPVIGCF